MYVDGTTGEPDFRSLRLLEEPGLIDFSLKKVMEDGGTYYEPVFDASRFDGVHLEVETQDLIKQDVEEGEDGDRPVEVSRAAHTLGISDPDTILTYMNPFAAEGDDDRCIVVPEILWRVIVNAIGTTHHPVAYGRTKTNLRAPTMFGDAPDGNPTGSRMISLQLPMASSTLRFMEAQAAIIEDEAREDLDDAEDLADKITAEAGLHLAEKLNAALAAARRHPETNDGERMVHLELAGDELNSLVWRMAGAKASAEDSRTMPEYRLEAEKELMAIEEFDLALASAAVREIEAHLVKASQEEEKRQSAYIRSLTREGEEE